MTLDLPQIFEQYSNKFSWRFGYGNRANNNLISDIKENEVYFLLDPVERVPRFSEYGGNTETVFNGNFMLLVRSTIDNNYHNQDQSEARDFYHRMLSQVSGQMNPSECEDFSSVDPGKYYKNILPLLQIHLMQLSKSINCSDVRIDRWSIVDAINMLDSNLDGVIVSFSLTKV